MGRQAKTPKFATFKRLDNCFDWYLSESWRGFFKTKQPLNLEIGCGTAELSLELARLRPESNFLGVDIKSDRMYKAALKAKAERLDNIAFVRANIKLLPEIFKSKEISEIWLTFPDPYPKKRAAKHRLLHPEFLAIYHELLASGGQLHFKTDDNNLFKWSLEQLLASHFRIVQTSSDLHSDETVEDSAIIKTDYEKKFMANNLNIKYCLAEKV